MFITPRIGIVRAANSNLVYIWQTSNYPSIEEILSIYFMGESMLDTEESKKEIMSQPS